MSHDPQDGPGDGPPDARPTPGLPHVPHVPDSILVGNLLDSSDEVIYFKDLHSRFIRVSLGCARLHRRTAAELIGLTDFDIFDASHARVAYADEQRIIATGVPMLNQEERERWADRPDSWVSSSKFPLRDADGTIIGTFGISRDVTRRVLAEQALEHQASHDPVTGLPNRYLLMDRLGQALVRLGRHPGQVALYFVDLDHFKAVNDTHGHGFGDRVLTEIGRRLTGVARREDTVARLGGDEFVVLCEGVGVVVPRQAGSLGFALLDGSESGSADPGRHGIEAIGRRIVAALAEPYVDGDVRVDISASVGAVVTDDPSVDPGELLRRADAAMYRAKETGRGRMVLVGDPRWPWSAT